MREERVREIVREEIKKLVVVDETVKQCFIWTEIDGPFTGRLCVNGKTLTYECNGIPESARGNSDRSHPPLIELNGWQIRSNNLPDIGNVEHEKLLWLNGKQKQYDGSPVSCKFSSEKRAFNEFGFLVEALNALNEQYKEGELYGVHVWDNGEAYQGALSLVGNRVTYKCMSMPDNVRGMCADKALVEKDGVRIKSYVHLALVADETGTTLWLQDSDGYQKSTAHTYETRTEAIAVYETLEELLIELNQTREVDMAGQPFDVLLKQRREMVTMLIRDMPARYVNKIDDDFIHIATRHGISVYSEGLPELGDDRVYLWGSFEDKNDLVAEAELDTTEEAVKYFETLAMVFGELNADESTEIVRIKGSVSATLKRDKNTISMTVTAMPDELRGAGKLFESSDGVVFASDLQPKLSGHYVFLLGKEAEKDDCVAYGHAADIGSAKERFGKLVAAFNELNDYIKQCNEIEQEIKGLAAAVKRLLKRLEKLNGRR